MEFRALGYGCLLLVLLGANVRSEPAAKPQPAKAAAQAEPPPPLPASGTAKWPPLGTQPAAEETPPAEEPVADLGPPLVEHPERLIRLHPKAPIFIDKERKLVIAQGQVCQRQAPLELFACLRNSKEHEAIVTIPGKAQLIHAGLVAVGAEPGAPARFHPQFTPARGQIIEMEVRWKEKDQIRSARAQDWVRNSATKKAMTEHWLFAGSGLWTHPETKVRYYQAEGGDLICLSNFPSAMLDVDMRSSSVNDDLAYEAFTERIPPKGTAVTLVLTPGKEKK